jgi:acyl transferase domain-containing protein/acyl carrier protein
MSDALKVAIVGSAFRFPGADSREQFWRNLSGGVESIRGLSEEELLSWGLERKELDDPSRVRRGALIDDIDRFDTGFFAYSAREAELMDPQIRALLECAWRALEDSGYHAERYEGSIGLFGGGNFGSYLATNLHPAGALSDPGTALQTILSNDKDYMTTAVAYKLDLRGPVFTVQSGCSTSLVAVHLACQALLGGEADLALAGGVSIDPNRGRGYVHQEGSIASPDGHCRAFDEAAAGTVFGNGVGLVVLKRLEDALADRDTIHAVLLGSAVNNDGSRKVGFTAPGLRGQAAVIAEALGAAGVPPESIGYVEAHGTGTSLGDPIEVAALMRAYGSGNGPRSCAIGSVKPNIGHLDSAAGVAGLLKAALALRHRQLPPLIHFTRPNPKITFDEGPFYANTQLLDWPVGDTPRRVGVSAFGIGGTNAHAIVEEAPASAPSEGGRPLQLLCLSARTPTALENARGNLANHLRSQPDLYLADAAYTLHVGRASFADRQFVVAADPRSAVDALTALADRPRPGTPDPRTGVVFLLPGHGAQHAGMGRELYEHEPVFRRHVDEQCEGLDGQLEVDLRTVMFQTGTDEIHQTRYAQPALFVLEYALAQLWIHWGVQPAAFVGHSVGELVAACLAGVFSPRDALDLAAWRARQLENLPPGAMLVAAGAWKKIEPHLGSNVELAATNAPDVCVLAGPLGDVEEVERRFAAERIDSMRLPASHAFHSAMVEPMIAPTRERLEGLQLSAPKVPILSTITGTWLTDEQAIDLSYWAEHARRPVAFAEAVRTLLAETSHHILEVGPGRSLGALVRRQRPGPERKLLASLPDAHSGHAEHGELLGSLGALWQSGVEVEWEAFYSDQKRGRVPLPTYPFEGERYWIDPPREGSELLVAESEPAERFFVPTWRRSVRPRPPADALLGALGSCLLIHGSEEPDAHGQALGRHLEELGLGVSHAYVRPSVPTEDRKEPKAPASKLERRSDGSFALDPDDRAAVSDLIREGLRPGPKPSLVVCLPGTASTLPAGLHGERGFRCLVHVAQAIGDLSSEQPVRVAVVATGSHDVLGGEEVDPNNALLLGPCRVIPQEYPHVTCKHIDVAHAPRGTGLEDTDAVAAELLSLTDDVVVAYRGGQRWVQTLEGVRLEAPELARDTRLRTGGVYLITGGLGGLGRAFATDLAKRTAAKLVLTSRSGLPPRDEWPRRLSTAATAPGTARAIQTVQALEALGAEVLVAAADVSSEEQMRAVLEQASARFGRVNGVIHAAGVAGGGLIQLKTREAAAAVLAPKVRGTDVLGRALGGQPLDFFVLTSSLTAVVGGVGQVDYCAANAYLDAWAGWYRAATGTPTFAINWTAWREAGMAVETELPEQLTSTAREVLLWNSLTDEDGADALSRILAWNDEPRIAVSARDLRWVEMLPRLQHTTDAEPQAGSPPAPAHSRPELSTAYVAPGTETEKTLAAVWQELFRIDRVGLHDNFFDLGGHSLLATQLVSRVKRLFGIVLPLETTMETPTVASLAERIEVRLWALRGDPHAGNGARGDEKREEAEL